MNYFFKFSAKVAPIIAIGVAFLSCNKDDIIEDSELKPSIIPDSETGIYTVKTGHELTIAPEFKNCENADITWTMNGKIVCRSSSWTKTWDDKGEYYVTLKATNKAGIAQEELRVDVLDLTPPVISLAIPEQGLQVAVNTEYAITPSIQHSDIEGFKIAWYLNDSLVGTDISYTFRQSELGIYKMRIDAENIDGKSSKEFNIEVLDKLPALIYFPSPSLLSNNTTRYVFAGHTVCLRPYIHNFNSPHYQWSVNGEKTLYNTPIFQFTPDQPGEYTITVSVSDSSDSDTESITRNITRTSGIAATANVTVVCVDATESERMRAATSSDSRTSNKVFEYIPAPGQFIGEKTIFDDSASLITSHEEACKWAQKRLDDKNYVSLGSFGGYIIVGFDHSIVNGTKEYDFTISDNAFDSSNEPGIVWVMQDVNGNGLPDDEWYELKGSEYDKSTTEHFYSVTYFRPADESSVEWIDCNNVTGTVDYLPTFHNQPNYYPAWVKESSYTLYGSCLKSQNSFDSGTGLWTNPCYKWGYADNLGDNTLNNDDSESNQHICGFKISNAVYITGDHVELKYIDFVKVQTAVLAKSGVLGEISTEVLSIAEY